MKEWNKPELFSLEVENTLNESSLCTCGATTYKTQKNEHYCHRENLWHQNNCPSLNAGHIQGAPCPTEGKHEWQGESHKSKCCCGSFAAHS